MTAPDPFDLGRADRARAIAAGEVSSEAALDKAAHIRAASQAGEQAAPEDEPGAAA